MALVKFQLDALTTSVVTDGNGFYRLPRAENVSVSGALVSISKPEHFTATKDIPMSRIKPWTSTLKGPFTSPLEKSSTVLWVRPVVRAWDTAAWGERSVAALS